MPLTTKTRIEGASEGRVWELKGGFVHKRRRVPNRRKTKRLASSCVLGELYVLRTEIVVGFGASIEGFTLEMSRALECARNADMFSSFRQCSIVFMANDSPRFITDLFHTRENE